MFGAGGRPNSGHLGTLSYRHPCASAKTGVGGPGVGQFIVKHMVDAHAGTITAASEGEGRGATFTVRLPALSEAAVPVISGR